MAEPMDLLFSTPKMSTAFSPEAHVQGMLAFEAAVADTPVIPLVHMLTARVGGDAQKFVHWGATGHDAIDFPEDAPTMVMVNSMGTDLRMWDSQRALLSRSLRVVRYDCRGHGASTACRWKCNREKSGKIWAKRSLLRDAHNLQGDS